MGAARLESDAAFRPCEAARQRDKMQGRRRRAAALVLRAHIGPHLGLAAVFHRQDAIADAGALQPQNWIARELSLHTVS